MAKDDYDDDDHGEEPRPLRLGIAGFENASVFLSPGKGGGALSICSTRLGLALRTISISRAARKLCRPDQTHCCFVACWISVSNTFRFVFLHIVMT